MIDTPVILTMPPRLAAAIHVTIPRSEIRAVMGPTLQRVRLAAEAQTGETAGPWFTHHFQMAPDVFDFEVCVPVHAAFLPEDDVECRQFPALQVVRTVYRGPYEGLGQAWHEFDTWIASARYLTAPDLFECYVAGPESGLDPSAWQTELTRPLAGRL